MRAATLVAKPTAVLRSRAPSCELVTTIGPVWTPMPRAEVHRERGAGVGHTPDDLEAGLDRADRVVLRGGREPEVHDDTVALVLVDVTVELLDDAPHALAVRGEHLQVLLEIEPLAGAVEPTMSEKSTVR